MNQPSAIRAPWAWPVLLAAVLAVSTGALFARLADPAPALSKAAWRCTIAAAVLLAIGGRANLRQLALVSARDRGRLLLAGLLLATHFGTWILSLDHTTVTTSLVLVTTTPVWTAILAPWLLGERTSRRQWQGIGLCAVGIAILAQGGTASAAPGLRDGALPWLGNLLALAGAVSFALFLIVGRDLQRRLPALPYLSAAYGGAAASLVLVCLLTGMPLLGFPASTTGWLLALALVPQLLGHSGYNLALRHLSAATVAITLVGEPVFGSLLAWLVLGEVPGSHEWLGGAFLLTGILRAARRGGGS